MVIQPTLPLAGLDQLSAAIDLVKNINAFESKIQELKDAYKAAADEIAKLNSLYPGVDLINKADERAAVNVQIASAKLDEAQKVSSEAAAMLDAAKKASADAEKRIKIAEQREIALLSQSDTLASNTAKLATERTNFEAYKQKEIEAITAMKSEVQGKIDAAKALLG